MADDRDVDVKVERQPKLSEWALASIGRALHHVNYDTVNSRQARDMVSGFLGKLNEEGYGIVFLNSNHGIGSAFTYRPEFKGPRIKGATPVK